MTEEKTKETKKESSEEKFEKVIEKEIEEKIEKTIEETVEKSASKFGHLVAIAIQITLIWAAHNVLSWNHSIFDFVLPEFTEILWIIDISLGVSIFSELVSFATSDKKTRGTIKVLENCASLVLGYFVFTVFPYDFREIINLEWINTAIKVATALGMFGLFVSTITEIAKLCPCSLSCPEDNKKGE